MSTPTKCKRVNFGPVPKKGFFVVVQIADLFDKCVTSAVVRRSFL